jgi:hypothetical protein
MRDKINRRERERRNKDREEINRRERERYHNTAPQKRRERRLTKKYGLTLQTFNNLFAQQNYQCAGCKTREPGDRGWVVDHDHKTKKVRGILCHHCNTILGHAKDRQETLIFLVTYLQNDGVLLPLQDRHGGPEEN